MVLTLTDKRVAVWLLAQFHLSTVDFSYESYISSVISY